LQDTWCEQRELEEMGSGADFEKFALIFLDCLKTFDTKFFAKALNNVRERAQSLRNKFGV